MAVRPLSDTDVAWLLEEGSSLSPDEAREAVHALSNAGVEIVEANSGQAKAVDGIVNSLLKADVGIKDRGVIGGLAFRRNRS